MAHVLNTTVSPAEAKESNSFSYSSPPTALKLSETIEGLLKQLQIDLVANDRVEIPIPAAGSRQGEWTGSSGLQEEVVKVNLKSGRTLDAD